MGEWGIFGKIRDKVNTLPFRIWLATLLRTRPSRRHRHRHRHHRLDRRGLGNMDETPSASSCIARIWTKRPVQTLKSLKVLHGRFLYHLLYQIID